MLVSCLGCQPVFVIINTIMDTKQTLISFVDILLRVPSLLILDEVFQSNLADLGLYPCTLLPLHKEADFDNVTGDSNHTMSRPHHSVANYNQSVFGNFSQGLVSVIEYGISTSLFNCLDNVIYCGIIGYFVQIGLLLLGIALFYFDHARNMIIVTFLCSYITATCISLFTLTLWTKQLVKLYEFLFSILLIMVSFQCNQLVISSVTTALSVPFWTLLKLDFELILQARIPSMFYILGNVAIQSVLASGYLVVSFGPSTPFWQGLIAFSFLLPSLSVCVPIEPSGPLWCFVAVLSIHVGAVLLFNLTQVCVLIFLLIFFHLNFISFRLRFIRK